MLRRVLNSVSASVAASAPLAASAYVMPALRAVAGSSADRAFSTTPVASAAAAAAAGAASSHHHGAFSGPGGGVHHPHTSQLHHAADQATLLARISHHFTVGASANPRENHLMHTQPTHTLFGAAIRAPRGGETKKKNVYAKRPIRAPRHGASTVVGRSDVRDNTEGVRAPTKAPPFPKPKFTRQVSSFKEHHAEQARAEYAATHLEVFDDPEAAAAASAATAAASACTKPVVKPEPATKSCVAANSSTGKAAVAGKTAVAPTAEGAERVSGAAASTVVSAQAEKAPQCEVNAAVARFWRRAVAPLSIFRFSVRDQMAVYASLAAALTATYLLYKLLHFELVYYGIMRSSVARQKAKANKVAAAAAAATTAPSAKPARYSSLQNAQHYLGEAGVLLASTVPWHFVYLSTASLLGRKPYAQKFLVDWANAVLPMRTAAWYSRMIGVPISKSGL